MNYAFFIFIIEDPRVLMHYDERRRPRNPPLDYTMLGTLRRGRRLTIKGSDEDVIVERNNSYQSYFITDHGKILYEHVVAVDKMEVSTLRIAYC